MNAQIYCLVAQNSYHYYLTILPSFTSYSKVVDCPTQLLSALGFSIVVFHDKATRTQQGNLLGDNMFKSTQPIY